MRRNWKWFDCSNGRFELFDDEVDAYHVPLTVQLMTYEFDARRGPVGHVNVRTVDGKDIQVSCSPKGTRTRVFVDGVEIKPSPST